METAVVTIDEVEPVGPDTVAVTIETPAGFEAQPGQFVKLSTTLEDDHISRFYTISSPGVDDTIEVTVGIDPDGTFGPWLREAVGESVTLEGPFGTVFYQDEPAILVLAGGPGIGPAIGIGERALDDDNVVTIIYRSEQPAHMDRLNRLRTRGATVVITEGAIEPILREEYEDQQIFVYGFQEFVSEAVSAIDAIGANVNDAKIENFG